MLVSGVPFTSMVLPVITGVFVSKPCGFSSGILFRVLSNIYKQSFNKVIGLLFLHLLDFFMNARILIFYAKVVFMILKRKRVLLDVVFFNPWMTQSFLGSNSLVRFFRQEFFQKINSWNTYSKFTIKRKRVTNKKKLNYHLLTPSHSYP